MATSATLVLTGPIALVGGARHPHAARRLREAFPQLHLTDAAEAPPGRPAIRLALDPSLPEGGFCVSVRGGDGAAPSVVVSGGPFSGVIYGAEEFIATSRAEGAVVRVRAGETKAAPGLAYRTFWTWDHSTNWELSQVGVQEIGVFNPYSKPPAGFLADYRRLVDFASRHRIAAVVIFGFLRDTHGGVAAGQELCRYANERGVRILPGIAIGAYGGVYWEGNNPYNLTTWLRDKPDILAQMERGIGFQFKDLDFPLNFPRSDYTVTACPSRPETMDWMVEGVSWLAETFELGGVNIESGDYGVCGCARCRARRGERDDGSRREGAMETWSHTDMADNFPRLFAAANAKRDNLWVYSELQWDNMLDPKAHEGHEALPPGGIYQHTMNRSCWPRVQKELSRADVERWPTRPNVFRCQFACQWNGDRRTERYAFNARTFADMSAKAAQTGIQGLTVWGEPSPYQATVEMSYLAFSRFGYEPTLSWDRFVAEDMAPRLGGVAEAERFVAIASELDANLALDPARLKTLRADAREAGRQRDDEAARRWLSIEDTIARRQFMGG